MDAYAFRSCQGCVALASRVARVLALKTRHSWQPPKGLAQQAPESPPTQLKRLAEPTTVPGEAAP